jgi:hypothetical protein
MDDSFFAYLQQLEVLAFFAGYPLIYAAVVAFAGNRQEKNKFKIRSVSLLPFAYALVGILFLGFQLKKLYPDYSVEHLKLTMQQPWLIIWGLLSLLFWIPALAKKRGLSLIHSLVFFFFLAKDLFVKIFTSSVNDDVIRNDMNIYTSSLLLNLGAFAFIVLIYFLFTRYKSRLRS